MPKEKKKTTEIVKHEAPATPANDVSEAQIGTLLQLAVDKNVPVETIERLVALRDKFVAEAAKRAYDDAMSHLQGELPVIEKTKIVLGKDGKERYRYAPIDAIIGQTKGYISANGFSYAITTEQSEIVGEVKAICTVKHREGHSEMSTFRVPIDKESYMTAPQKVGSALTFAKRYAFCNAFGIITGDADNDANEIEEEQPVAKPVPAPAPKAAAPAPAPAPTKKAVEQKTRTELMRELHALLKQYGMTHKAFCDAYQVDTMEKITDAQIVAAIKKLRERVNAGEHWVDPNLPTIEAEAAVVDTSEVTTEDVVKSLGGEMPAEEPAKEKELSPGMKIAKEHMEKAAADARIAKNLGAG